MHIPDDPILWKDRLWSALQRAITAPTHYPQSAFGYRRNTEDGLNIIAINSLAKDAELSDRPVYVVREDKGNDGRVLRRWLQVNHPGPADPIRDVKIFERFYGKPTPQSQVDLIIAYLRAWQTERAKQLRPCKTKPTGKRHPRPKQTEPTPRQMEAYRLHVDRGLAGQDLADALRIKSRSAAWRLAKEAKRLINGKKRQSVRTKIRYDETEHRN